uniref:Single-stranded DNA-binding protein n=1 Tax=Aeromonas sp. Ne-1 TaxID=1675689 RepID=A0A0H4JBV8_9GAMM|nr:single-stranded DNA-binding protein [Aeromonas sp. Ne-1]
MKSACELFFLLIAILKLHTAVPLSVINIFAFLVVLPTKTQL